MSNRFILTAQLRLRAPKNISAVRQQIANQLSGIKVPVNLGINTRQLTQLRQVQKAIKPVAKAAEEASVTMEKLGKGTAAAIKRFGAFTLATTILFGFISAIRTGTAEALDFEKQMIKIGQVTGFSVKSLSNLNKEITDLSVRFGVSSSKLVEASRTLSQAGLTANQAKVALEALAKSDLAPTFEDITKTTEGSIAIMRQFRLETNQLEGALGSINAVAGKFAVESGDLITAVRRTGGAFKAAGGELNELIALFTSVRSTTRESAESIATGFRTIFTRLQRTRTQNFLADFNIDLRATAKEAKELGKTEGEFIGPFKAVEKLSKALRNLSSTDPRFSQITEELGGFRQVSKVIPLIQQFAVSQNALNVAKRGTTSLASDSDKAQKSLANQLAKVGEEFSQLIRKFSQSESIKEVVSLVLSLAKAFVRVSEAIEPVLPAFTVLATLKVGQGFKPFLGGFKQQYNTPSKFATGGKVPGKGHGDTVPALLTPGEFVIRKKAAQAIGDQGLQRLNKFAAGGKVQKFTNGGNVDDELFFPDDPALTKGAIGRNSKTFKSLFDDPRVTPVVSRNQTVSSIKVRNEEGVEETLSLSKPKALTEKNIPGVSSFLLGKDKSGLSPTFGAIAYRIGQQAGGLKTSTIAGNVVPSTVSKLQALYPNVGLKGDSRVKGFLKSYAVSEETKKDFGKEVLDDVARSVGRITSIYGGGLGFDPKKEFNSIKNIVYSVGMDNMTGSIFESMLQSMARKIPEKGQGFDFPNLNDKQSFTKLFGKISPEIEFLDAKRTAGANTLSGDSSSIMAKALRVVSTGRKELMHPDPFSASRFKEPRGISRFSPSVGGKLTKKAKGGKIDGIGSSDTVPAMLTPGEFVINKDAASKIGSIGLNTLNRADKIKGFADGGFVGGAGAIKAGSEGLTSNINIASIFLLLTASQQIAAQFGFLNDTVKSWISTISVGIGVFAAINAAIGQFITTTKNLESAQKSREKLQEIRNERTPQLVRKTRLQERLALRPIRSKGVFDPEDRKRAADAALEGRTLLAKRAVEREAATKNIRVQNKLALVTQGLVTTFGALSTIVFTAGSLLSNYAESQLKAIEAGTATNRKGAIRNAGLASGLQGAAIGGLSTGVIISQFTGFLGPLGQLIASLTGVVGGALTIGIYNFVNAVEQAKIRLDAFDFGKKFDLVSTTLKRITDNRISALSGSSNIKSFTRDANNRILTLKDPNERETLSGQLDNLATPLQTFINKITDSSGSLEEFQSKVGEDTIALFTRLTKTPISEFNKNISESIQKGKELNRINTSVIKAQQEIDRRLRTQRTFTSAIKDSIVAVNQLKSTVNDLGAFSRGSVSGESSVSFGAVEQLGRIGNISNLSTFSDSVTKAGNVFGQSGTELASTAIDVAKALEKLPDVLIKLERGDAFGISGGALSGFKREFKDSPKFIVDALSSGIEKLLGAEGQEPKLFNAIRTNLEGSISSITKGLDGLAKPLGDATKDFQTEFNSFTKTLSSRIAIEKNITDQQSRLIDARDSRLRVNAKNNDKRVSISALAANETARRSNILGSNAGSSPESIANQLAVAQKNVINIQETLATNTGLSSDRMKELTVQLVDQKSKVSTLSSSLSFLADATKRTAVLQTELGQVQKDRRVRFDLASELTFGSKSSNRELGQTLKLSQIVAAVPTAIDKFSDTQKSSVRSLLEKIGDTRVAGLGNKTGTEVLKSIVNAKFGSVTDIDKDKEKSLISTIDETTKISIKSRELFIKNQQSNFASFLTSLKSNFDQFLSGLKSNLASANETSVNRQIAQLSSRREILRRNVSSARGISQIADFETIKGNVNALVDNREKINLLNNGIARAGRLDLSSDIAAAKPILNVTDIENILSTIETRISGFFGDQVARDFNQTIADKVGTKSFIKDGNSVFRSKDIADIVKEDFKTLISQQIADRLSTVSDQRSIVSNLGGGSIGQNNQIAEAIIRNSDSIKKALKELPKSFIETEAIKEIKRLNIQLKGLQAGVQKKALGGFIRGSGSGDTVPAMLTPGEFVVKKTSAMKMGPTFLHALNDGKIPGFNDGGFVEKGSNKKLLEFLGQMGIVSSVVGDNSVGINKSVRESLNNEAAQRRQLAKSAKANSGGSIFTKDGRQKRSDAAKKALRDRDFAKKMADQRSLDAKQTAKTSKPTVKPTPNKFGVERLPNPNSNPQGPIKQLPGEVGKSQTKKNVNRRADTLDKNIAKQAELERLKQEKVQQQRELAQKQKQLADQKKLQNQKKIDAKKAQGRKIAKNPDAYKRRSGQKVSGQLLKELQEKKLGGGLGTRIGSGIVKSFNPLSNAILGTQIAANVGIAFRDNNLAQGITTDDRILGKTGATFDSLLTASRGEDVTSSSSIRNNFDIAGLAKSKGISEDSLIESFGAVRGGKFAARQTEKDFGSDNPFIGKISDFLLRPKKGGLSRDKSGQLKQDFSLFDKSPVNRTKSTAKADPSKRTINGLTLQETIALMNESRRPANKDYSFVTDTNLTETKSQRDLAIKNGTSTDIRDIRDREDREAQKAFSAAARKRQEEEQKIKAFDSIAKPLIDPKAAAREAAETEKQRQIRSRSTRVTAGGFVTPAEAANINKRSNIAPPIPPAPSPPSNVPGVDIEALRKRVARAKDRGVPFGRNIQNDINAARQAGATKEQLGIKTPKLSVEKPISSTVSNNTSSTTSSTSESVVNKDFMNSMNKFQNNVETLVKALDNFPREVQLTGRHFVEVVFNGTEAFQNLKPEMMAMVEGSVKEGINNMLKEKFPEVGLMV